MDANMILLASEKDKITITFAVKDKGKIRSMELSVVNRGLFDENEFLSVKKFIASIFRISDNIIKLAGVPSELEEGKIEEKIKEMDAYVKLPARADKKGERGEV